MTPLEIIAVAAVFLAFAGLALFAVRAAGANRASDRYQGSDPEPWA